MELKNKKVVITGASKGIGLEVVNQLLDEGAFVYAISRQMTRLDFSHERLIKQDADLSKENERAGVFNHALKTLGSIDLFISNAGFAYYERLSSYEESHVNAIYDLNVKQTIDFAVKMKELHHDKPFTFVSTISATAFVSLPGYALYSSTKAALRAFMDGYRFEMNKDQHLISLYPVATHTAFFERAKQTHKPWPVQKSSLVAKVLIKGIKKNKKNIHPSKIFKYGYLLTPWFFKLYNLREKKIFDQLVKKNNQ